MSDPVYEIVRGEYLYVFYMDEQDIHTMFNGYHDYDFCDENCADEYLKKFLNFQLYSYLIFKKEKCPCCGDWKFVDGLGAIHAAGPEEALEEFLNYLGKEEK